MKFVNYLFFLSFLLFFSNCSEGEKDGLMDITIQFGSECGWCAGQEYISINNLEIKYERTIPCGENKGTRVKSRKINAGEWNSIVSSFDYSIYKTLQYNSCNVCADGCDEIIRITEDESTHELRYSFSTEVKEINNLRKILATKMDEIRELN